MRLQNNLQSNITNERRQNERAAKKHAESRHNSEVQTSALDVDEVSNPISGDSEKSMVTIQRDVAWDQPNFHAWTQEKLSSSSAQDAGASGAQMSDSSGTLTRRLVSASNTFTIQRIISDAFKDLGELRLTAAMSDGEDATKAKQIIRRLERLIRRSNRKISDLNKEDALQRKQDKAERDQKMQRAREIETELRRQIVSRRNRERKYLEELTKEEMTASTKAAADMVNAALTLDAATEAKIAAKAQAIAAAEFSATANNGGGFGSSAADSLFSASSGQISGASTAQGDNTASEVDVSI